MNSPSTLGMTSSDNKKLSKLTVRDITTLSLMAAIMFGGQVAMAVLPNIEIVSVLVIACTLVFGLKSLFPIYVFVMLEGMIYGFADWWFGYLYVWALLALVTHLFSKVESRLFWAALAGIFGLSFGALFAVMDIAIGGTAFAFAKWISGIPYDIAHCAGNTVIVFLLLTPIRQLLERLADTAGREH